MNSLGMSVQLCYWTQNGGVSGRDPGSTHVHPADMIRPKGEIVKNTMSNQVKIHIQNVQGLILTEQKQQLISQSVTFLIRKLLSEIS